MAQNDLFGAKSLALGRMASVEDGWSVFNNSSQMVFLPTQFVLQCGEYYGFISSMEAAAGFMYSFALQSVGAGFSQNITGDFRRRCLLVAYAHKIGDLFSLSMQCRWISLSYSDSYYGVKNGFCFSLSCCYRPDEIWSWSVVLNNPACFHYQFDPDLDRLPTSVRLGMRYTWTSTLRTYMECGKSLEFPVCVAVGVEKDYSHWHLRGSVSYPEFGMAAGLGCGERNCMWDVACQYNLDLGATVFFSIQLVLESEGRRKGNLL